MAQPKAVVKSPLSSEDQKRLAALELIIDTGIDSFLQVGQALAEIQRDKLWRPYKTFQDYLAARWPEMCRSRAYQAIRHAKTYERVSTVVDNRKLNERATRELAGFPDHLHKQILERAKQLAGDKELTAPLVNQAGLAIMDERNRTDDDSEQEDNTEDAPDETDSPVSTPSADVVEEAAKRSNTPKLHPLLRAAEHHRLGRKDSKKTVAADMESASIREAAVKLIEALREEIAFLNGLLASA